MSNNQKVATKDQNWNSQELIKLSQTLGEAYLPGLDNNKSNQIDDWTMSKFIEMNKHLDSTEKQES